METSESESERVLPTRCEASRAPLAQSVERFHGKEEVFGSNPEGGSPPAFGERMENWPANSPAGLWAGWRRRSSVGESARLIIERSAVRVCPPLHNADA